MKSTFLLALAGALALSSLAADKKKSKSKKGKKPAKTEQCCNVPCDETKCKPKACDITSCEPKPGCCKL